MLHLSYTDRCLRTHPGKLLFGPTGERLFVDYLDKLPGFSGRIEFIHKLNLTALFTVHCSAQPDFEEAESVWMADRLLFSLENGRIAFSETKVITQDDCAISCQRWRNKTAQPMALELVVRAQGCQVSEDASSGALWMSADTPHGFQVGVSVQADKPFHKGPLVVMPGEEISFCICAAVGNLATETPAQIHAKSAAFCRNGEQAVQEHYSRYASFFEQAPSFVSSDAVLNSVWEYRWFLMRHTLARPAFGLLPDWVMYEGRSHKSSKTPLAPGGWEFSKLINLSTPLHLLDMRWHSDRQYVYGMIRTMLANRDENGIFCSAYVSRTLHAYANFSVFAVYKLWQADGCDEFIREILPALKRYVHCESKTYSRGDNLQIETRHNRTGKEYQPSYWSFGEYPENPKEVPCTPLKRVDRSVYHYLNVLGLAHLCRGVGDEDQAMYAEIAQEISGDILGKMWDEEQGFFFDLHHETNEKAPVRNIVGVYPHWAQITGEEHLPGLEALFDPAYFDTACPFPSVARDCKAYSPMGGWMGNFIKGRNGCVWCGPSWPYTTGIAIDAVALQSRAHDHRYDGQFAHLLREYALTHFANRNPAKPYLVEHYDAETGEPISDEPDYNHSYLLDLIVSHVAGVLPGDEGVEFSPLDAGLDFFVLDRLPVRGAMYRISYRAAHCQDVRAQELPFGYAVWKDGEPTYAAAHPFS